MQTKISIIVPVYNVENDIVRCLECLCTQTMKEIEVILVDDGSQDKSGVICDEYAKKYSNITVFHQENGGVSKARNQGLLLAKGEYIMFVDADDAVSSTICEDLYSTMIKQDADLVMSNLEYVVDNEIHNKELNENGEAVLYTQVEALYKITSLDYKAGVCPVAKLYKKQLIDKCKFAEGIPLGEDIAFVLSYLGLCRKVAFLNCIHYYYFMREGSATQSAFNVEKQMKLMDVGEIILKSDVSNVSEIVRNRMLAFRVCMCELTVMNRMIVFNARNRQLEKMIQRYIRKHIKTLITSDYPKGKRIQMMVLALSVQLYTFMYLLTKKK